MILLKKELLDRLVEASRTSARKRMNYNLHTSRDEAVQRFFNAMETDTYIRPHRHVEPNKFELFLCVRGRGAVVTFNDDGNIDDIALLSPNGECMGVEIPSYTWHTIVSLSPGTVFFEAKQGPFVPISDKDFAPWAPDPSDPEYTDYLERLKEKAASLVPDQYAD